MTKILIVLFVALFFEALGVVILKQGIDQITAREKVRQGGEIKVSVATVLRLVGHGFINGRVLLGVLFEATFFAGLLILMGHKDISFIWPLTSWSITMAAMVVATMLNEVSGQMKLMSLCPMRMSSPAKNVASKSTPRSTRPLMKPWPTSRSTAATLTLISPPCRAFSRAVI